MASAYEVLIDYTNHRGEQSIRRIEPMMGVGGLAWGSEHHPRQWVIRAVDLDRGVIRSFALAAIHSWKEARDA